MPTTYIQRAEIPTRPDFNGDGLQGHPLGVSTAIKQLKGDFNGNQQRYRDAHVIRQAIYDADKYTHQHLVGDWYSIDSTIYDARITELNRLIEIIRQAMNTWNVEPANRSHANRLILQRYEEAVATIQVGYFASNLQAILVFGHDACLRHTPEYHTYILSKPYDRQVLANQTNEYRLGEIRASITNLKDQISQAEQIQHFQVQPTIKAAITLAENYINQHLINDNYSIGGIILIARLVELRKFVEVIEAALNNNDGTVLIEYYRAAEVRIKSGNLVRSYFYDAIHAEVKRHQHNPIPMVNIPPAAPRAQPPGNIPPPG